MTSFFFFLFSLLLTVTFAIDTTDPKSDQQKSSDPQMTLLNSVTNLQKMVDVNLRDLVQKIKRHQDDEEIIIQKTIDRYSERARHQVEIETQIKTLTSRIDALNISLQRKAPDMRTQGCAMPWKLMNKLCLLWSSTSKSNIEAQRYCERNGGRLLIMRSEADIDTVSNHVSTRSRLPFWANASSNKCQLGRFMPKNYCMGWFRFPGLSKRYRCKVYHCGMNLPFYCRKDSHR